MLQAMWRQHGYKMSWDTHHVFCPGFTSRCTRALFVLLLIATVGFTQRVHAAVVAVNGESRRKYSRYALSHSSATGPRGTSSSCCVFLAACKQRDALLKLVVFSDGISNQLFNLSFMTAIGSQSCSRIDPATQPMVLHDLRS